MTGVVECLLCDKLCRLAPGERGDCRVRVNLDGRLVSLVYGKVCAVHVDPIEKKPMFHFLPTSRAFSIATAGCNLHCRYCQNWEISQADPEDTRNRDLPPDKLVKSALAARCQSIAYTYTDPVVFYEYTLDSCKAARGAGLKNVLVTAGFIRPEPLKKLLPFVDGANVDLKSMSDRFYREVCAGRLQPVLETIRTMAKEGVAVEVTNLIVPALNDDMDGIRALCDWVVSECGPDTPLHFSRFQPMFQLRNVPRTPVTTLKEARAVALSAGLHYVYLGNVRGGDWENTVCPACGETVVARTGFFVESMHIENGLCTFCQHPIPGVWA